MYKYITVYGLGTRDRSFHWVAGYREDGRWLIIRQGSFPFEIIHKVALDQIGAYTVERDLEAESPLPA